MEGVTGQFSQGAGDLGGGGAGAHVCSVRLCQESLRGKLAWKIKNIYSRTVFGNCCFCGILINSQEETEFKQGYQ